MSAASLFAERVTPPIGRVATIDARQPSMPADTATAPVEPATTDTRRRSVPAGNADPPVGTAAPAAAPPPPTGGGRRSRKPLAIAVGVAAITIVGTGGYALNSRQSDDAANVEVQADPGVVDREPALPDPGPSAIGDDSAVTDEHVGESSAATDATPEQPDAAATEGTPENPAPNAAATESTPENPAPNAAATESTPETPAPNAAATEGTPENPAGTGTTDASAGTEGTGTAPNDNADAEHVDAADAGTAVSGTNARPDAGDTATLPADVPESKGVVRNGQIFLEGAVPTEQAGAEIEMLAAEILGAENVFNNYVVDPRADDPNLGNLTVEDTINFKTDSANILPEAEPLLNQGLALMTIRPAMTITIVGHTDTRGTVADNQWLSERRAEAVKRWFVDRGIDPARLTAVGVGESDPIADDSTSEGQRLNRRIQFFLENILAPA